MWWWAKLVCRMFGGIFLLGCFYLFPDNCWKRHEENDCSNSEAWNTKQGVRSETKTWKHCKKEEALHSILQLPGKTEKKRSFFLQIFKQASLVSRGKVNMQLSSFCLFSSTVLHLVYIQLIFSHLHSTCSKCTHAHGSSA